MTLPPPSQIPLLIPITRSVSSPNLSTVSYGQSKPSPARKLGILASWKCASLWNGIIGEYCGLRWWYRRACTEALMMHLRSLRTPLQLLWLHRQSFQPYTSPLLAAVPQQWHWRILSKKWSWIQKLECIRKFRASQCVWLQAELPAFCTQIFVYHGLTSGNQSGAFWLLSISPMLFLLQYEGMRLDDALKFVSTFGAYLNLLESLAIILAIVSYLHLDKVIDLLLNMASKYDVMHQKAWMAITSTE